MMISEHFTITELTKTNSGLANILTPIATTNLLKLAETLEQIRSLFDNKAITINSAYRSDAVNKAVGGSPTSDHVQGLAADFIIPGLDNKDIMRKIINSSIKFDQLILEPAWVHIGIGSRMRNETLCTIDRRTYHEFTG